MNTIKAIVRAYRFDTRKADECAAWDDLRTRLTATYPHCMESWGGAKHYMPKLDGLMVDLETEHLFDNQWNTGPIPGISEKGLLRLFDWALDASVSSEPGMRYVKQGHYIEQTDEMRELRRNRAVCGYCGKQEPAQKGYVFCPHCIGSEYLKGEEIYLTRMQPVDTPFRTNRAPLTDAERAYLMPLYVEAQTKGHTDADKARIAKARATLASDYASAVHAATVKRDAYTWLMDRGIKIDNVIYYSHTDRFCFGWRKPLDGAVLSALLDLISEFQWPYEIKCADGRTLSGD